MGIVYRRVQQLKDPRASTDAELLQLEHGNKVSAQSITVPHHMPTSDVGLFHRPT